MHNIKDIINKIYIMKDLSIDESEYIFNEIMNGNLSDIIISSFLTALKIKGESYNEILAATNILRKKSKKINSPENTIDTCGTGGDMSGSLNISTASALVAASVGVIIAKHGNRSVSSKTGSADVLEKLKINISMNPEKIESLLNQKNFCFMFAQDFHLTMKHVAPVRKELGTRTIFNLLGPLLNPANAKKQLLGVYDKKWLITHIKVLKELGSKHVIAVNGFDGLDEISLSGNSYITELKDNNINEYIFDPKELGYSLINNEEIKGGDSRYNADRILKLLNCDNSSFQKIVEINSGAAIYLSGIARNIKEGCEIAKKSITEKKAKAYYESLINQ